MPAIAFDAVAVTSLAAPPVAIAAFDDPAANYPYGDTVAFLAEPAGWETWSGADAGVPDVLATAASGADFLWLCSEGTSWIWLDPGNAIAIGDACGSLQARDDRALVLGPDPGDDLMLRVTDGTAPVDLGVHPALFALAPSDWTGAPVAWADVGDTVLTQRDDFGESTFAAGGGITAIGWGSADWVVGTELGVRELGGGDAAALPAAPTQVGAGDFDADGVAELWAFDGATFTVVQSGTSVALGLAADTVVVADFDGDGCAEVAGIRADASELQTAAVLDCPGRVDADGDGYLPWGEDPDCGPDDPNVHPGAVELCDGLDQDCDGAIDEINTVALDAPTADEGSVFSYTATVDGCGEDSDGLTIWDWQFLGEAECQGDGPTANCLALDDGDLTTTLTVTLPDGSSIASTSATTVENLAPYLLDGAIDWGDHTESVLNELDLDPGEVYTVQLVAGDPGADTVTFGTITSGVPVELTEDGLLTITAGTTFDSFLWTLVLTDDDGGSSEHEFTITVGSPGDTGVGPTTTGSDSLCCSGGGVFGLLLGSLLLRGRT